ncbi:hypothetical protein ACFVH6_37490 [Spirillospora sp. NPDC127200]
MNWTWARDWATKRHAAGQGDDAEQGDRLALLVTDADHLLVLAAAMKRHGRTYRFGRAKNGQWKPINSPHSLRARRQQLVLVITPADRDNEPFQVVVRDGHFAHLHTRNRTIAPVDDVKAVVRVLLLLDRAAPVQPAEPGVTTFFPAPVSSPVPVPDGPSRPHPGTAGPGCGTAPGTGLPQGGERRPARLWRRAGRRPPPRRRGRGALDAAPRPRLPPPFADPAAQDPLMPSPTATTAHHEARSAAHDDAVEAVKTALHAQFPGWRIIATDRGHWMAVRDPLPTDEHGRVLDTGQTSAVEAHTPYELQQCLAGADHPHDPDGGL